LDQRSIALIARQSWRAYGFAVVMGLCAVIPGCNFLYSTHDSPLWVVLYLVFPITLYKLWRIYRERALGTLRDTRLFLVASLAAYTLFTYVVAERRAPAIQAISGLPVPPLIFWSMFFFPLNLPFVWNATG
jgi:hypothetical protein